MHDRALDYQVAALLGDKPVGNRGWRNTQGHTTWTTDGGPPFYSAGEEWGTPPLLLAEIEKRGLRAEYCEALMHILDPGETYALYDTAIESSHPSAHMPSFVWLLLTATPERHCRAFVEVCRGLS
jgi:hypothetical protein